jgi:hypothetical protein
MTLQIFLVEFINTLNALNYYPNDFNNFGFPPQAPPSPVLHILPVSNFMIITTLYAENIKILYELPMDEFTNIICPKNINKLDGVSIIHPWRNNILIPNVPEHLIQSVSSLHLVTVENQYFIRFESYGKMYSLITNIPPENFVNLYTYNNVSVTSLNNFALIPKSELNNITPSIYKLLKLDLDCYRIITNISKKDIFN